jgi:hypothetical protein
MSAPLATKKMRKVNFFLPVDLVEAAMHRAIDAGFGPHTSKLIEIALREYIDRHPRLRPSGRSEPAGS